MHALCFTKLLLWKGVNYCILLFECSVKLIQLNICFSSVGYAYQCDVINQDLFAPCHAYISPELYYQLCRFDACKCGSTCLCNALAHYAYVCHKHGITVDFRSHVSYCGELLSVEVKRAVVLGCVLPSKQAQV